MAATATISHPIAAEPDPELKERVHQWFIDKGVPHFGPEPSRGLLDFALPLLAVVLAFELVAIPWLAFGHVQEVLAHFPGGAALGDGPRLALAITVVILAGLIAIAPAVPLCRGPLPGRRPAALPWRLDAAIRAGSCLAVVGVRLAPLAAVILWLSREDAFVGLRAGDFVDAAVFSVLLIVAIQAVSNGAS